jgi:hypothetical protein
MKLCPCKSCGPQGASLPKSASFPEGEPYLSAGCVPRYVCSRCGTVNTLSKAQWNVIPDLTIEDFERLAKDKKGRVNPILAGLPTRDLEGAGFTKDQAKDLFRAGFNGVSEVEAISRG